MVRFTIFMVLVTTTFAAGEVRGQLFRRNAGGFGNYGYQQPFNYSHPAQPQQMQPRPVHPQDGANQVVPQSAQPASDSPTSSRQDSVIPVPVQSSSTQTNQPRLHWSQTLIQNREHDFGQVAKLAKTEHVFEFVNPLDTDLYLENARASCLCTRPTVLTPVVKPGETARILAAFDTRGFSGQRGATVSVTVRRTQPYWESAELTLSVKGTIRTDVVMEPGEINFGQLRVGADVNQSTMIKYAGKPEWGITEAIPSSDRIRVTLEEVTRDAARRRVDYRLTVATTPDMPKGEINEQVILKTNDEATPTIVVPVQGRIRVGIEASDIRLGNIEQGKSAERKLIVRGDSSFAIIGIQSSSPRVRFQAPDNVYRNVHVLTYWVDASEPAELEAQIALRTTDRDQPLVNVNLTATVVGATFASDGSEVAHDR